MQRMKLHHYFMPHTKINAKWIKDLNVRPETIKLLEESIDSKVLPSVLVTVFFFYLTAETKATKAKINK